MELDGYFIEIHGYNFKNDRNPYHLDETRHHQINLRIKKKTEVTVWEDDTIKWDVEEILA